jgi:hypothetical protein
LIGLVIGPAYQVTTVVTKDGRNLTTCLAGDNEAARRGSDARRAEAVPRNRVKYTRVSKRR